MHWLVQLVINFWLLLLYTSDLLKAQKLELNALEPCPSRKNMKSKPIQSIELIFHVGCNVSLECRYLANHCESVNATNLTIRPPADWIVNSMVVLNRTKCHLVMELHNLNINFSGFYICNDTIHGWLRHRTMFVGYPPDSPTNLTLVYQPGTFVSLNLNRIKTGDDLNDPYTQWNVNYIWGKRNFSCQNVKPAYNQHSVGDLFVACVIDIRIDMSAYINKPIHFSVRAVNIYGRSNLVEKAFNVSDFIKPRVKVLEQIQRGTTWLYVRVRIPSVRHPYLHLKIKYTVKYLLKSENNEFFHLYGIRRNFINDKEAIRNSFNKGINWTEVTSLNVTGLPPNTRVNITLQAKGRYIGPELGLSTSETYTTEDVPWAGPEFAVSPYLCYLDDKCMICAIYFLEIPEPLRGGNIMKYILNGTRMKSHDLHENSNCHNKDDFSQIAGEQDNTFLIMGLEPNASYSLQLQANVSTGMSPIASCTLLTDTSSVPGTPTHVIVERSFNSTQYTVKWHKHNTTAASNFSYYIHYCYAQSFDDSSNNFNCRTNMITNRIENNSYTYSLTLSSDYVRDLEPSFFVSLRTPDGRNGGLIKADCFYSPHKAPGKAESLTVHKSDIDPRNLVVHFKVPCGQNYRYSRPHQYHIHIKASSSCAPFHRLKIEDEVNATVTETDANKEDWSITKIFQMLRPNTMYCVIVRTSTTKHPNTVLGSLAWKSVFIGDIIPDKGSAVPVVWVIPVIIFILLGVTVIILFVWCQSKCKSAKRKFEAPWSKIPVPQTKNLKPHLCPEPSECAPYITDSSIIRQECDTTEQQKQQDLEVGDSAFETVPHLVRKIVEDERNISCGDLSYNRYALWHAGCKNTNSSNISLEIADMSMADEDQRKEKMRHEVLETEDILNHYNKVFHLDSPMEQTSSQSSEEETQLECAAQVLIKIKSEESKGRPVKLIPTILSDSELKCNNCLSTPTILSDSELKCNNCLSTPTILSDSELKCNNCLSTPDNLQTNADELLLLLSSSLGVHFNEDVPLMLTPSRPISSQTCPAGRSTAHRSLTPFVHTYDFNNQPVSTSTGNSTEISERTLLLDSID